MRPSVYLAAATLAFAASASAAPSDAAPPDAAASSDERTREASFAVVPGPFYNPSLGLGLMVMPMVMFHLDADDEVSPTSVAMLNGLYAVNPPFDQASTRSSWFAGGGGRLYLDEDRWRVQVFAAYLDLFQQYYGIGGSTSSSALFDYRMGGALLFTQVLRQVGWKELYLGALVGYTAFRARTDDPANQQILEHLGTGADWTGQPNLGLAAQYDTRNSQYYPSAGVDLNLRVNGSVDSAAQYLVLAPSLNQYFALSGEDRVVLAYRVFAQLGFGELPLGSYAKYGQRGTTLGYTTGEYMDKMMGGVEAEVRWLAFGRVGLEGGAGVGKVFPDLDHFGAQPWLPGVWGSVTYQIMQKQDIRARVTLAEGKGGGAFYFAVGQNF